MDSIPVSTVEMRDKKWILSVPHLSLQCAYCLAKQELVVIRDHTGLVKSLGINWEYESHMPTCPQKNNKEGNTDGSTTN